MAKRKAKIQADEIPICILTNERTPFKAQMILMIYKAASLGQLAYMDGVDPETGETDMLLVGLEPTENGKFNVFPLAKLFNKSQDIPQYLVPDGNGNYIDYSLPGTAASKEEGQTSEGGSSEDRDGGTLGGRPDPTLL